MLEKDLKDEIRGFESQLKYTKINILNSRKELMELRQKKIDKIKDSLNGKKYNDINLNIRPISIIKKESLNSLPDNNAPICLLTKDGLFTIYKAIKDIPDKEIEEMIPFRIYFSKNKERIIVKDKETILDLQKIKLATKIAFDDEMNMVIDLFEKYHTMNSLDEIDELVNHFGWKYS